MAKQPVRVMIADDDGLTRALLRGLLRNESGYEVIAEAGNGEVAVETAVRLKPDVIFLDVTMPKLGGIEALKQLREQLPGTPVLMVTGHADRETVQTSIDGGAAGYIVKPFNAARVMAALKAARVKARAT